MQNTKCVSATTKSAIRHLNSERLNIVLLLYIPVADPVFRMLEGVEIGLKGIF